MFNVPLHPWRSFVHVLFCHLPTHTFSASLELNPALAEEKSVHMKKKKQLVLGKCIKCFEDLFNIHCADS